MSFLRIGSRARLLYCAASLSFCAQGAFAQEAHNDEAQSKGATITANPGLSDIVVTAQRTSQSAQKIPVTVSAVTADQLQNLNITSIKDLEIAVPGLVMDRKSNAIQPFIRGIGLNSAAVGVESPIATYVDGMYLTSPVATAFELSDVERVEVLKGPQGTLFGRNATGGAINIATRDPGRSAELNAEVGYESYRAVTARIYAATPVSDTLSIGVSGFARNQGEGWGTSLAPDGSKRDFRLGWQVGARAKAIWNVTPNLDITLGGFYIKDRSNLTVIAAYPGETGLVKSGVYAGYTYKNDSLYGTISDYYSDPKFTYYGGNGKVAWDVGWATLINNFTYQRTRAIIGLDSGVSPIPDVVLKTDSTDKALSNEFQIQSPQGAPFRWIAGFYYLHENLHNYQMNFNAIGQPLLFQLVATAKTDSWAPYIDATTKITNRLSLTAGLRYSHDTRRLSDVSTINAAGTRNEFPDRSSTFEKVTYRAALQYDFSDDVMAFASYSRGFKSGFYSMGSSAGTAPPLRPEILDAYEAGFKSTLFDRRLRLNISAFHYIYKDIAVTRTTILNGIPTTVQENAAKAKNYGVDVEAVFRPNKDFTLSVGATYLPEAEYTRFPGAPKTTADPGGGLTTTFFDAAGNRLLNAPRISMQGAVNYTAELPEGSLVTTIGAQHRSTVYFSADNRLAQDPVTLVNLSTKYIFPSEKLSMSLWVKNVFNKKYITEAQAGTTIDYAAPGSPRIFGFTFGLSM